MKVAYIFATQRHNVSYVLGKIILPQLEEKRHGVTVVGMFFFAWDRLSRLGHLTVTWLVAIGSNLSALWILIANAWMQNPVGAHLNARSVATVTHRSQTRDWN